MQTTFHSVFCKKDSFHRDDNVYAGPTTTKAILLFCGMGPVKIAYFVVSADTDPIRPILIQFDMS